MTSTTEHHADVHLDTDRNVAVLTLDRPAKLNALTSQMTATLAGHVAAINADAAIRAVVITGAGRALLDRHRDGRP